VQRHLLVEEFDAAARADQWLAEAGPAIRSIVEAGTWLDADDVDGFTRLALPGVDEAMAVFRLVDAAADQRRLVVDTAPTGHTLRLLDAADHHAALARALRAMADKAAVVASSMVRQPVRLAGEAFVDELESYATSFRQRVLGSAAFVVATRAGGPVQAETVRLLQQLASRRLHVAAVVQAGAGPAAAFTAPRTLAVPLLEDVAGCAGLRAWRDAVRDAGAAAHQEVPPQAAAAGVAPEDPPEWLVSTPLRMLVFAGKGGTGKTTCAAAAALVLAEQRPVLLCSTDPAGSLDDVLGPEMTRAPAPAEASLRIMQVDAAAGLERFRSRIHDELVAALERLGLTDSAAMDRRVLEAVLDLAPPGMDELAALSTLLDAADEHETIVLDTAPTGHFLRLLAMPELALDWTRQVMRIVVKYHISGVALDAPAALLELARELRRLRDRFRAGDEAGVVIVTLDEPVVQAETARLAAALVDAGITIAATIHNRAEGTAGRLYAAGITIRAPLLDASPVGRDALRRFAGRWKIVA
jgi:arsenite/tail-anchored protein-transporting ATPase